MVYKLSSFWLKYTRKVGVNVLGRLFDLDTNDPGGFVGGGPPIAALHNGFSPVKVLLLCFFYQNFVHG